MSLASEIAKMRAKQAAAAKTKAAARRPAAAARVNRRPAAPPRRLPVSTPKPVNPAIGGARGNVEQNYRGVPGLVNATAPMPKPVVGFPGGPGGKTTYSNDPRPVTGVINPRVVPPANASPAPVTGDGLYDAIRGLPVVAPSLGGVNNIGANTIRRDQADFGILPQPGQGNPFGFANPEVFYGNQPSIGGPILGGNLPPAVGFGGTAETGYMTPFNQRSFQENVPNMGNPGQVVGFGGTAETGYMTPFDPPAVGFGNPNFGLFGQPPMSNGMTQFGGNVGFPASNTYGQGLGQIGRGLFGQQPNMNQFYNMNANQGMDQSLGSMGSMGFGGQFNNMQPQMAMQQSSQQGPPPSFSDSFAYRPL